MRNRVDKLGVSEPEVRKQGADQIVIQLAGVHDPRAAAALIGKTAQLEFYDLEADLTGPSKSVSGQRDSGAEHLLAALRPAGARQGQGRERVVPLRQEDEAADRRACGLEGRALQHEAGEEAQHHDGRHGHRQEAEVRRLRRAQGNRRRLLRHRRERLPGRERAADGDRAGTSSSTTRRTSKGRSGADGRGSGALRNARRPRPEPGPGRPDGLHRRRQQEVPGRHQGSLPARRPAADSAALRDRARPPDQVVAADRLHGRLARERHQRQRPDHRHRLVRRGEEPRARPPDRFAPVQVHARSRARTSPRRSARTPCRRRSAPRSAASSR